MISLKCKVCNTYSNVIKSIKTFSRLWAIEGSTNLRHSNVLSHANGQPHKKAMELHLKQVGLYDNELADEIRQDERQRVITVGIANMQAGELEKMIKKFEIAYVIAKEEMP